MPAIPGLPTGGGAPKVPGMPQIPGVKPPAMPAPPAAASGLGKLFGRGGGAAPATTTTTVRTAYTGRRESMPAAAPKIPKWMFVIVGVLAVLLLIFCALFGFTTLNRQEAESKTATAQLVVLATQAVTQTVAANNTLTAFAAPFVTQTAVQSTALSVQQTEVTQAEKTNVAATISAKDTALAQANLEGTIAAGDRAAAATGTALAAGQTATAKAGSAGATASAGAAMASQTAGSKAQSGTQTVIANLQATANAVSVELTVKAQLTAAAPPPPQPPPPGGQPPPPPLSQINPASGPAPQPGVFPVAGNPIARP
jgi:hypothetical protein